MKRRRLLGVAAAVVAATPALEAATAAPASSPSLPSAPARAGGEATVNAAARPLPPAEVSDAVSRPRLVGHGSLRFFGLQVYEARLWAAPSFDARQRYDSQPFALELLYARKLDGAAIAERSIAEMKRVGPFGAAQAKAWLTAMTQAFPPVVAGDRLVGVNSGGGAVRFFHNGHETAALEDAEFGRLFFGIWLAAQTSAPALREALLGLPAGSTAAAAVPS